MTLVIWSRSDERAMFGVYPAKVITPGWGRAEFVSGGKIRIMSSRSGNWMLAVGTLMMFGGLCFLPAVVGEHAEADLLAAGAALFSVGALMTATGIYLKAGVLKSAIESGDFGKEPAAATRRSRGGCDLCGTEAPVIHCKVHQLHLCGNCLAQHYDIRSCAYVPTTRTPANKNSKNQAAKARGA